jgi:NAD(P)-dependent dehydrogenase (short-subunit alcohol dehydrogenase family)
MLIGGRTIRICATPSPRSRTVGSPPPRNKEQAWTSASTDKVAVVTGAGKGSGLAITQALVDEGAHVVAGSRTTDSLDGLDRVTAVAVDLAAPKGPAQLIQRATDQHGRFDVLVNHVGAVRIRSEGFLGTSDDEFEWAMQMNFFIALRASRAAVATMVERGGGAIVHVASVNAFFQPNAGTIDYGAAKAALVNLSKSLAQEFGPRGIRVNCLSPGPVATDLWLGEHGVAETVARRSSRGSADLPPAGSPPPNRWPPWSRCWPPSARATSPGHVIDGGLIKTT